MNNVGPNRAKQALWLMLTVSAAAFLLTAAYNYSTCRTDSLSKVGCFIAALLVTALEAIVLIVVTVFRLLKLILP